MPTQPIPILQAIPMELVSLSIPPLTVTLPHSVNIKKQPSTAGFDNKAYQHQRHFSQATTASTKQSPSPPTSSDPAPAGIGETTYQEWLNKVSPYHKRLLSSFYPFIHFLDPAEIVNNDKECSSERDPLTSTW